MNDKKEKQDKKGCLTSWAALLTAIATVLGAIGFNQFFPDIVKRYIFGLVPTPSSSVASSESSPSHASPSIKTNSSPSDSDINLQSKVSQGVTVDLKYCLKRAGSTVSCLLLLSSDQDKSFFLSTDSFSKLVDSSGNEYYADRVKVGNRDGKYLHFDVVKGARHQVTFNFVDVPTTMSQAVLLQIQGKGDPIKFRNVSIN